MIFISCVYLTRPKSRLWYTLSYSYFQKRNIEQNLFEKKNGLRPFLKTRKNQILESFSDSHYYEELMNVTNYKPKILKQDFNRSSFENTSGYNSKQNSNFNNFFEDDVALRINQLNQSLIRIKALNREISLKNGTDLPILYFD